LNTKLTIHDIIELLCDGAHLTREQSARAMDLIMTGEATNAQMAALLIALRMKGETSEEITGFAQVMRLYATRVATGREPLLDTCGTGGDCRGTFNVSTTAALVAAGAGVIVAKHGNRAASSRCGSADVLEALGVNINLDAEQAGACIDEVGIGFLFARTLHKSMKYIAPVRLELKARTVFNILGPLTNPAEAKRQVVGVFNAQLAPTMARALLSLGTQHAFVVAGEDGLDELSISGPSLICEASGDKISEYEINPHDFGLKPVPLEAILGGDPMLNASITRRILEGEHCACRDMVVLNTAPALVAGGVATSLQEGILMAAESIDSGAALSKLNELIAYTRGLRITSY
jgi:anthranilate phosphoribosyltransferase